MRFNQCLIQQINIDIPRCYVQHNEIFIIVNLTNQVTSYIIIKSQGCFRPLHCFIIYLHYNTTCHFCQILLVYSKLRLYSIGTFKLNNEYNFSVRSIRIFYKSKDILFRIVETNFTGGI